MLLAKKVKDINLRKSFFKNEVNNITLKFVYTNFFSKERFAPKFNTFKDFKQKNYSRSKIVRRCIYNNRAKGNIRPFNISRSKLRNMFQFGIIPGYKKAV
jgi:ribosomal protein S14